MTIRAGDDMLLLALGVTIAENQIEGRPRRLVSLTALLKPIVEVGANEPRTAEVELGGQKGKCIPELLFHIPAEHQEKGENTCIPSPSIPPLPKM